MEIVCKSASMLYIVTVFAVIVLYEEQPLAKYHKSIGSPTLQKPNKLLKGIGQHPLATGHGKI